MNIRQNRGAGDFLSTIFSSNSVVNTSYFVLVSFLYLFALFLFSVVVFLFFLLSVCVLFVFLRPLANHKIFEYNNEQLECIQRWFSSWLTLDKVVFVNL